MADKVDVLRIVVASPGDVEAEYRRLKRVVKQLNRGGLAKLCNQRLELWRWETDACPGFNIQGRSAHLDSALRIEECDVLIAIFWKRFDGPLTDGEPRAKQEFDKAYEAWRRTKRPHIMTYFCKRDLKFPSAEELNQIRQVLEFQENFPKEGTCCSYNSKKKFENEVRYHLEMYLLDRAGTPFDEKKEAEQQAVEVEQAVEETHQEAAILHEIGENIHLKTAIDTEADYIQEEYERLVREFIIQIIHPPIISGEEYNRLVREIVFHPILSIGEFGRAKNQSEALGAIRHTQYDLLALNEHLVLTPVRGSLSRNRIRLPDKHYYHAADKSFAIAVGIDNFSIDDISGLAFSTLARDVLAETIRQTVEYDRLVREFIIQIIHQYRGN